MKFIFVIMLISTSAAVNAQSLKNITFSEIESNDALTIMKVSARCFSLNWYLNATPDKPMPKDSIQLHMMMVMHKAGKSIGKTDAQIIKFNNDVGKEVIPDYAIFVKDKNANFIDKDIYMCAKFQAENYKRFK